MRKRINSLYGNIDNMIRKTGTFISRSYLYLIINDYSNITLKVAIELKKLLQLESLDELVAMLDNNEIKKSL